MSKVVFELSDGIDGEIQLRDNEFMDFWKMVFVRNNKLMGPRKDQSIGSRVEYPINKSTFIKDTLIFNLDYHAECVRQVNSSIKKIKQSGWNWTQGKLNKESSFEDCNRIHRGFTTYFWTGCTDHLQIPFDKLLYIKYQHVNFRSFESKFLIPWLDPDVEIMQGNVDPEHPRSWYAWERGIKEPLHNINAYVHKLEDSCLSSARSTEIIDQWHKFNNKNYKFISTKSLDWDSKAKDQVTDDVVCDWDYAGLLRSNSKLCSSDPKYNVYDLKNILGKDYEKAWKDYDSPANWDITNTYNTTKGAFEIKPWQSYCTRKIIRPWVKEYNLPTSDQFIAPITLGHIDETWMEQNFFTEYAWESDRTMIKVDLI